MELATVEFATVCLPGMVRQSESNAEKYASNPPLCQTIGKNQTQTVTLIATVAASRRIQRPRAGLKRSENSSRGATKRRNEGRKPAARPAVAAAATASLPSRYTRQQR